MLAGSRKQLIAIFIGSSLAACGSQNSVDAPEGVEMVKRPPVHLMGICNGSYADVDPSCNGPYATIGLTAVGPGATGNVNDLISQAIGPWNELLQQGQRLGVPVLGVGSGSKTILAHFRAAPSGDMCGATINSSGQIDSVVLTPAAQCGSIQTGSPAVVLRHEIAHVLGWDNQHGGDAPRNSAITGPSTGRCATFIFRAKTDGPLPAGVCPHEVEVINRAYTSGWTSDCAGMYDQEMLMNTNASPRVAYIPVGSTAQVSVSQWLTWPSSLQLAKGAGDLAWSSDASAVASVSGSGVISGVQQGNTWIHMKASANGGNGMYALWTPFRDVGDSVQAIVPAPPPPPPPPPLAAVDLVVKDSATDVVTPAPLTVAGVYTAWPTMAGQPQWTHVLWQIVDSRSPHDTIVYDNVQPHWSFNVSPGDSYNLRFIITPYSYGTPGFYGIFDVPICAEGGQQLLRIERGRKGGGGSTNAIGGC